MNGNTSVLIPSKKFKIGATEVLDIAVLGSFVVSIVWLLTNIAQGNTGAAGTDARPAQDYTLMLLQCCVGVAAIHIPLLLNKFLRLEIPKVLHILFSSFLFCAIFLGEVGNFYYLVPHWDDVLHLTSGMMLCLFGFMLANILNKKMQLSPAFVAVFGFCFALAIGGLWEIYEFAFDGLLGLNMQKTMLASGEALVGHAAIADTMKDIVMDAAGAIIGAVVGYRALKNNRSWITGGVRGKADEGVPFEQDKPIAA